MCSGMDDMEWEEAEEEEEEDEAPVNGKGSPMEEGDNPDEGEDSDDGGDEYIGLGDGAQDLMIELEAPEKKGECGRWWPLRS